MNQQFTRIEENKSNAKGEEDTKSEIDFKEEREKYKDRTEMELPYTLTQAEDAMYINQQFIVSLEYHYF